MRNITINTEKELKELVNSNRRTIVEINGVEFGKLYPILTVTNKHATYYNIDTQSDELLHPPFNVILDKNKN